MLYVAGVLFWLSLVAAQRPKTAPFRERREVGDRLKTWEHECPGDGVIKEIYLDRGEIGSDRPLRFTCSEAMDVYRCENSGYVNKLTDSFHYKCPSDKVLTGIKSLYNPHANDHRFSFQCCKVRRSRPTNCRRSEMYDLSEDVRLRVPRGWAVTEVHSFYKRRAEGRKWRFEICETLKPSR
ncbi:dermatopontin-like [Physella acuta]|uniref:dermatopontin-like n=1 Tax=Physella acuta TaxID=109671 RepID=UPI0027DDEE94|nr:dermatopontin-like [Physella acuta]